MMDSQVGAAGVREGVRKKPKRSSSNSRTEQKKYADWVALGTVDLDSFVEDAIRGLKRLRGRIHAREDGDETSGPHSTLEIKVDCYTISCIPLKSAVEKQIKELQDALSGCLQRKVLRSKEEMEAFIASGKIVLDTNAQTVEEIGNLRIEAQKLMAEFSRAHVKITMASRRSREAPETVRRHGRTHGGGDGLLFVGFGVGEPLDEAGTDGDEPGDAKGKPQGRDSRENRGVRVQSGSVQRAMARVQAEGHAIREILR